MLIWIVDALQLNKILLVPNFSFTYLFNISYMNDFNHHLHYVVLIINIPIMCLALFLIMLRHYWVGGFNFLCLQHQVLARISGAKLISRAAAVSCFSLPQATPPQLVIRWHRSDQQGGNAAPLMPFLPEWKKNIEPLARYRRSLDMHPVKKLARYCVWRRSI